MADLEKACKAIEDAIEKTAKQLERELGGLRDKLNELAEQWEEQEQEQESRYPKKDEWYWHVSAGRAGAIAGVVSTEWDDTEMDKYHWDFQHGSTDRAKVEWTIKHIELVNEIKKYTRPYIVGENNWYFVKTRFTQFAYKKCTLTIFEAGVHNNANEYGYFDSESDIEKVIEQFGREYILKFLFEPRDGNYKAIMEWLEEQEEEE